jgi:ribose transport system substrate-binding protein
MPMIRINSDTRMTPPRGRRRSFRWEEANVKARSVRFTAGSPGPRRRALRLVGAVAAATLVLAGCGDDDKPTASSAGATGTADLAAAQKVADQYTNALTEITQKEALGKPVPAGKTVIFANSGLPGTQLIGGGVKEAVEALGWRFDEVTYENANPATLQAALRTALSKKPDAVIIAGNAPSTYGAGTLAAFKAANVPLIAGSVCPLEAVEPLVAGAAGCEVETAAGKVFASWFIADSKGAGQALFVNVKAIPSLAAFVNAFKDEVSANCSACKVDVQEATLAQIGDNSLVPSAVNKLRTNSSYNYLFFDNAQFSKGITPALKAAGLDGKIKVGGRSADEGAIAALNDKTQAAWTALAYNVVGYGNVDATLRKLVGAEARPVVPPFQLLTPENVQGVKTPYRYPEDGLEQYKKIWGVS